MKQLDRQTHTDAQDNYRNLEYTCQGLTMALPESNLAYTSHLKIKIGNFIKSLWHYVTNILQQEGNYNTKHSWPGGEESVHYCPRHLDHTEPQSPDTSLQPDDNTCSQGYTCTVHTLSCLLEGCKNDIFLVCMCGVMCTCTIIKNYAHHKLA